MKKFLSVFIALAMVLSLFAGVGAKSAKAATGVISSTIVPGSTSYVAGSTVTITSTTVYGDMSAYSLSSIDGLVTLSKSFSTDVTINATWSNGTSTPVALTAYKLPAGSTTFWLSYFNGSLNHNSCPVASTETDKTDVYVFTFTAPSDTGSLTVTGQTVVAPTLLGTIGFEIAALRTVISTATASFAIAANTLTVAKVVDPTLLYAGVQSYAYVRVTDVGGNPVTGLTAGAFVPGTGSVAGLSDFAEVGYGIYELSGVPTTAGTLNLKVTNGLATGTVSFYVSAASAVWNPTLQITSLTNGGLVIGGTITFDETEDSYNVGTDYTLHDFETDVTGPTTSNDVIWTGGQFVVTLNANVWVYGKTALNATPIYGTQVFKISPVVSGDQVTIAPTSVNVGDTKDVTVTVKQPSGVERNNGKVVLTSTVSGMFTVPAGAIYTAPNAYSVQIDASLAYPYNTNIVGGNYVFAGLTFNHAGTIDVRTYGTSGGLTGIGKITVGKRIHTLTADVAKFVAGVAYPVVNVTGGVTGLNFTGLYADLATTAPLTTIDNGDGSYKFNIQPVLDQTSVTYTATVGTDDKYVLTMPIVKPTLTITSVHKDGLITDSLAETVTFTLTDPVTGAALTVVDPRLAPQYTTWDVTGGVNLAVSQLTGTTTWGLDHWNLKIVSTAEAKATTGNPNLDTTVDKPYVSIVGTVNDVYITYADALLVSPAIITVTPKDLVLYYNQSNMFSVNALDAHKGAISGATVYGENDYLQTVPTTLFGGVTGADGTVAFQYVPNYIGQISIETSLGTDPYVVQIVPAPADTTAPVITVTAGIDGSTVAADTLKLTGSINEKVSAFYVGFNKVDVLPDGSFMTLVKLAAGANTIDMTAYDLAGNKGTKSIKVTFTPAAAKTVIMLTIGTDVVTVNGKATSIDAVPEIVNGRTFVPIRFIAETFGATVDWLAETQGITVTLGDSTIGLQIGNATAVINGSIMSLEAAPYIKNGRTMVPLRVISEAFGGDVAWDPALRTITITY